MSRHAMILILSLFVCVPAFAAPPEAADLDEVATATVLELGSDRTAPQLGDPTGWSHNRYLDLAADWPHPVFRAVLLTLSNHTNAAIAAQAGVALTRYPDHPAAQAAVQRLLDDTCAVGDQRVGELVRQARAARGQPAPTTPAEWQADCRKPAGLSYLDVPRAVAQLTDPDADTRFNAFRWLASRGIFLDLTPLQARWSALSPEERCDLLQLFTRVPPLVGHEQLAEQLYAWAKDVGDAHDQVQAASLHARLWLGLGGARWLDPRGVWEDAHAASPTDAPATHEPSNAPVRIDVNAPAFSQFDSPYP